MKKSEIIVIGLLALILLGVLATFVSVNRNSSLISNNSVITQILNSNLSQVLKAECTSRSNEILRLIKRASYCSRDSDCISSNMGCSFGCYGFINKNSDYQNIYDNLKEFNDKCGETIDAACECPLSPRQDSIECKAGQCVKKVISGKVECNVDSDCPQGSRVTQNCVNNKCVVVSTTSSYQRCDSDSDCSSGKKCWQICNQEKLCHTQGEIDSAYCPPNA